jgi:hypothetical protein
MFLRDLSLTDAARNPGSLVAREAGKPTWQSQVVIQEGKQTAFTSRHFGVADSDEVQVVANLSTGTVVLEGNANCKVRLWEYPNGPARDLAGRKEQFSFRNGGTPVWLVPVEARGVHRVFRFQLLAETSQ